MHPRAHPDETIRLMPQRKPYSERLFAEIDSMILAGDSLDAILHVIASRMV
jgi:hypothetical protein